jgi:hypothetical protein
MVRRNRDGALLRLVDDLGRPTDPEDALRRPRGRPRKAAADATGETKAAASRRRTASAAPRSPADHAVASGIAHHDVRGPLAPVGPEMLATALPWMCHGSPL